MPLSNLPMPVMFLFFLLLFLLVGLYPAWRRTSAKIKRLLKSRDKEQGLSAGGLEPEQTEMFVEQTLSSPLDDFEIMVIRRLSQEGDKGLSRKQIDAALFLGKETVNKSLQTLMRRGLVYLAISPLFIFRFYLSDQGLIYAIEHEFILPIHDGGEEV